MTILSDAERRSAWSVRVSINYFFIRTLSPTGERRRRARQCVGPNDAPFSWNQTRKTRVLAKPQANRLNLVGFAQPLLALAQASNLAHPCVCGRRAARQSAAKANARHLPQRCAWVWACAVCASAFKRVSFAGQASFRGLFAVFSGRRDGFAVRVFL